MPKYGTLSVHCAACGAKATFSQAPGATLRKMPCPKCKALKMRGPNTTAIKRVRSAAPSAASVEPDYEGECSTCGASPIVPISGLCGPCTFGEADTAGGNW